MIHKEKQQKTLPVINCSFHVLEAFFKKSFEGG
jgi:hypothetical protein